MRDTISLPKAIPSLLLSLAAFILAAPRPVRAADPQFIIVQPGYPGSTAEASTFIADLEMALESGGAPKKLHGEYYNDAQEALQVIERQHPAVGVLSLGFFLAHQKELHLEPILWNQPLTRFYLAGRKGETVPPRELAGKTVVGTPFQEPEFVSRILFGPGAGGVPVSGSPPAGGQAAEKKEGAAEKKEASPNQKGAGAGGATGEAPADVRQWKVEATQSFSKGARDVEKGKAAAVLVTAREKSSLEELEAGKKLEVYWQTEDLPVSLVVAFPQGGAAAQETAKAFAGLKSTSKSLLEQMGIEGFAPIDKARLEKIEKRYQTASEGAEKNGRRADAR
jgi:hypothetical protein